MKELLDIVIVTYNRKECLRKTLEQIFAENSPIRDFDITVLNNHSDDGSTELINEYTRAHHNLKHIVNNKNINGCPNIAKALVEVPTKEYVWVLCDNDEYDWSCWNEVEQSVKNGFDVIVTRNCKNNVSNIFYTASLTSGCIYKTSNIDSAVTENIYSYIKLLFPHLAVIAKNINDNNKIYIVSKDIVHAGINPDHKNTFVRGCDKDELAESRKNIFWSVGYFSSVELVKDRKKQIEIIDGARHYHKSLFDLFKSAMIRNKLDYKNYAYNFYQIFRVLNFRQKLKLICAFLLVNLSFKDYRFYNMRSYVDWVEYFEKINEQKYIDKLSQKLKGKKIILYGAGLTAEVLFEKYDLSKLNIIGISDRRFERSGEQSFYNIKTILPQDLSNTDFDYLIFTMKLYKKAEASLREAGIVQPSLAIIKKNIKYAVRS